MSKDDARFLGSIPEYYDRHLGPVIFEPFAVDLAGRVAAMSPQTVLEVACGTGIVTRRMLERLPAGTRVVATDLNLPMLDHAERAVGPDERVKWRVTDAASLPFADAWYDAYVCQFGYMFFPDRLKAAREAKRVLKTGGKAFVSMWERLSRNRFAELANETLVKFFPEDPPKFYQTPFNWHDEADIRQTFEKAGFHDVKVEKVERMGHAESARHFAVGLVQGNPSALEISERGAVPHSAVIDALADALALEGGEAPFESPLRTLRVTATA